MTSSCRKIRRRGVWLGLGLIIGALAGGAACMPDDEVTVYEDSRQKAFSRTIENQGLTMPEEDVQDYAMMVCGAIEDGIPLEIVVALAQEKDRLGRTVSQHSVLAGAAGGAYCPDEWEYAVAGVKERQTGGR